MKLQEMQRTPTSQKLNKVVETRFGYEIDFDNLSFKKAYRLASRLDESIQDIKRTHGARSVEKYPTYMEMLMVRESLHRWIAENKQRFVMESEMAKSEAILAAKAIVDSVQDMLEKISKLQSEQMPALLDSIRDQIGTQQAETFKSSMTPLLSELMAQLTTARETADSAARGLAGEETGQPTEFGGAPVADTGMGPDEMGGMAAGEVPGGPMPADDFAATDAAAGGPEELGRERR